MSLLLDIPFKIHIFKIGSICYAKTNDGKVIASSSNDLGSVLEVAVDSLSSGGSIRISSDSYGWDTNITCINPRIGIYCETGNVITPEIGHTGDLFTVDNEHFVLENANIDCSNMSNGAGTVLSIGNGGGLQSDLPRIMKCRIKNPPTHGIFVGPKTNGAYISDNSVQSFFSPTGSGILIAGSGDHMISGNHSGGFGSGVAINLSGGGPSIVRGNECFSSLRGIAMYLSSEVIVANNLVQACNQQGIRLHSDAAGTRRGIIIEGNRVMNNSKSPTNTYGGIELIGSAGIYDAVSVQGNVCYDNQGTPTQKYGINVVGTIYTATSISNNVFSNNITAGLNQSGTMTGVTLTNNVGAE